jgi:hypothetical protein
MILKPRVDAMKTGRVVTKHLTQYVMARLRRR